MTGVILVHCDSGRGRAPTMAAAILWLRDVSRPTSNAALSLVRERRPVSSPTQVDVAFLRTVSPALRDLQGPGHDLVDERRRVRQPQAS